MVAAVVDLVGRRSTLIGQIGHLSLQPVSLLANLGEEVSAPRSLVVFFRRQAFSDSVRSVRSASAKLRSSEREKFLFLSAQAHGFVVGSVRIASAGAARVRDAYVSRGCVLVDAFWFA